MKRAPAHTSSHQAPWPPPGEKHAFLPRWPAIRTALSWGEPPPPRPSGLPTAVWVPSRVKRGAASRLPVTRTKRYRNVLFRMVFFRGEKQVDKYSDASSWPKRPSFHSWHLLSGPAVTPGLTASCSDAERPSNGIQGLIFLFILSLFFPPQGRRTRSAETRGGRCQHVPAARVGSSRAQRPGSEASHCEE